MVKSLWLNLPVSNIAKARQFYSEIGFSFNEQQETAESACMVVGERKTIVMLFSQQQFERFTRNKIPTSGTQVLLSVDVKSREEVDTLTLKARAAGAKIFAEPAEAMGWMYGSGFEDLDGHRWNVLHMDLSKLPQQ